MIIIAAVVFGLGSILTALIPDIYTLITGRIGISVAIGITSFIVPLYIAKLLLQISFFPLSAI